MTRVAARIYRKAAEIARLESLSQQLQQDQRVQLTLDDGSTLRGIVSATPGMQAFFDPAGREGLNALVRIETEGSDHRADDRDRTLWLDQIVEITRLPNPSPPASSCAPLGDPNAPTMS